jgi:predicted metalloprotease
MRWQDRRASTNVEDRRGMRMPGGRPVGLGCGGLLLVIVVTMLLGGDPMQILQILGGAETATVDAPAPGEPGDGSTGAPSDQLGRFAAVVLADTEDTWQAIFQQKGASYAVPNLVLFSGMVESACGFNSAAVGPFYCPPDQRVYIDLSFFDDLERRFGAPGDFAQAYVIAHEVGHHVQNLFGISDQVRQRQQASSSQAEVNAWSVRLELQADCLAGVWGHHAAQNGLLEPGDLQEGMQAAAAIGDDRLQEQAQGRVAPESFTHGSSEERVSWFTRGANSGDPDACSTFN